MLVGKDVKWLRDWYVWWHTIPPHTKYSSLDTRVNVAEESGQNTAFPFLSPIQEQIANQENGLLNSREGITNPWEGSCHYLFLRLRPVATGDRTQISRTRGERCTYTPPRWSSFSNCHRFKIWKGFSMVLHSILFT